MDLGTKECGRIISRMAKVPTLVQKAQKEEDVGNLVCENTGLSDIILHYTYIFVV